MTSIKGSLLNSEFLKKNPVEYFTLLTWRDWNPEDSRTDEQILEAREQARIRYVAELSTSPLYQARAAKWAARGEDYWKTVSPPPNYYLEKKG